MWSLKQTTQGETTMKTRDQILVEWAHKVQAAPRKQKKLVAGKALKWLEATLTDNDGILDREMYSMLSEEFEELAYK